MSAGEAGPEDKFVQMVARNDQVGWGAADEDFGGARSCARAAVAGNFG